MGICTFTHHSHTTGSHFRHQRMKITEYPRLCNYPKPTPCRIWHRMSRIGKYIPVSVYLSSFLTDLKFVRHFGMTRIKRSKRLLFYPLTSLPLLEDTRREFYMRKITIFFLYTKINLNTVVAQCQKGAWLYLTSLT